MSTYAVIPVKGNSERVASKNFRPFADGMSLTELKLRQLVKSEAFDGIFISSDAPEAEELCSRYGATFLRRDAAFCNNVVPWSDVIHHVAASLPIDEDDLVCWSHTTSPLFSNFKGALDTYSRVAGEGYDGLVTVARLNEYIVTERGRPVNYAWGVWHPYTQDVEPLFRISGALYLAKKGDMVRYRYVVSKKPYLYETTAYEALDVDTDYDFRLAQLLHEHRSAFAPLSEAA